MKNSTPKADPQFWANKRHLSGVLKTGGPEAATEAFHSMQGGKLPPIADRDHEQSAAWRRWNLPESSPAEPSKPEDAWREAVAEHGKPRDPNAARKSTV